MGPQDPRDLMFASAGLLWGAVTVYRGMRTWNKEKTSPGVIAIGIALAASCISYLVYRL